MDGKAYTKTAATMWLSDYQLHLNWLQNKQDNGEDVQDEIDFTLGHISKFQYLLNQFN